MSAGSRERPWLDNEQWAAREVIVPPSLGGGMLSVAWFFFGGLAWLVLSFAPQSKQGGAWTMALLLFGILALLTFLWLRGLHYGASRCRLRSLPAVLGGWLKADIECELPDSPQPPSVRLLNFIQHSRSREMCWSMECALEGPPEPIAGTTRRVLRVRARIPPHDAQVPLDAGRNVFWDPVKWMIEVRGSGPWLGYKAEFSVPVFSARYAPLVEEAA